MVPTHICPEALPEKETAVRLPDGTLSAPPILPTPMRWRGFDWGDDGTYTDYWSCPLCGEVFVDRSTQTKGHA